MATILRFFNELRQWSAISTADLPIGAIGRVHLTTPTTFYVATNGNDSNDGLTSLTPWLTLTHAMAVLIGQYDFGGQDVTLQANAGNASFVDQLHVTAWTGGGQFIFDGGGGSITVANSVLIEGSLPSNMILQNVALNGQGGVGLDHNAGGQLILGGGLSFGVANPGAQIRMRNPGAKIQASDGRFPPASICTSLTFTGPSSMGMQSSAGQLIIENISLIASGAYGVAFVFCNNGVMVIDGNHVTNTATGARFNILAPGQVNTGGAQNSLNANYIPGDSAGSTWSNGLL